MKNVALALSSGGPRGFAYIGAIEELLARGYRITSVAGTSAGSLVGGVFAAGGLEGFKEWLYGLDPVKVVSLMDFSLSKNHLVKGDRVIEAIRGIVPDVNIEDLPLPFTAIATDLFTGEEVIFREGPLFEAIRASISIPSMFRPVHWHGRTLVDGGLVNTFPLNRVQRTENDILVGFNVNAIDAPAINRFLRNRDACEEDENELKMKALSLLKDTLSTDPSDAIRMLRDAGRKGGDLLRARVEAGRRTRKLLADSREENIPTDADDNYVSILDRSFGIMNQTIAQMGIDLCPPDILVSLPYDSYQGVYGYSHAEEIANRGRTLMAEALDAYEKSMEG